MAILRFFTFFAFSAFLHVLNPNPPVVSEPSCVKLSVVSISFPSRVYIICISLCTSCQQPPSFDFSVISYSSIQIHKRKTKHNFFLTSLPVCDQPALPFGLYCFLKTQTRTRSRKLSNRPMSDVTIYKASYPNQSNDPCDIVYIPFGTLVLSQIE